MIQEVKGSKDGEKWLTQQEVAQRLRRSEGSIINYRKQGRLPFFMFPGSNRPLYPLEQIEAFERRYTHLPMEVVVPKVKAVAGVKGKPVMSNTNAQWRI